MFMDRQLHPRCGQRRRQLLCPWLPGWDAVAQRYRHDDARCHSRNRLLCSAFTATFHSLTARISQHHSGLCALAHLQVAALSTRCQLSSRKVVEVHLQKEKTLRHWGFPCDPSTQY